ncbi:hypothetical protein MMC08_002321 [Hypocenomyce scalaris]|nr:hypothetical protein [Hypocenomyce scalaris]
MASAIPPSNPHFYLKTHPLPHAPPSKYTSLYIRHHGSGFNSVVLTKAPPKFLQAAMIADSSRLAFVYNGRTWGFVMRTGWKRAGWEMVRIVEDEGDERFSFGEDGDGVEGLRWEGGEGGGGGEGEWRGWMVCEWAHGLPQLFWVTDKLKGELPGFCERVRLVREFW